MTCAGGVGTMRPMRDLTDEFKLSVRSIGEVIEALGAIVNRLAVTRRIRFRGKKPTRAAVVNAAVLYLESLAPPERERALAAGMERLERLLEVDPTVGSNGEGAAADPAPPRRVGLTVEDAGPPPSGKSVRRKKGG